MLLILILVIIVALGYFAYQDGSDDQTKAGKGALCISALFPIIGVIIYFVQMNKIEDSNKYLKWAFFGFLFGLILNIITNGMRYALATGNWGNKFCKRYQFYEKKGST